MGKLIKEFQEFALKGNVVDMAVGIVIGGAFGKIVSSFVADVLMPPLGMMLGGVNFTELKYVLKDAVVGADGVEIPAVTLNYGSFIQTIFDFIIIAFAIFMAIKGMNSLRKKEEPAPEPAPAEDPEDIKLLREIRDSLKK